MSYLDQLRQTVKQNKLEEIQKQAQLEQQQQKFYTEVTPVLKQMYSYFAEIIQYINYIQPEVTIHYQLKGCGALEDLSPKNYRLVTYRDLEVLKQKNYTAKPNIDNEFLTQSGSFMLTYECRGQRQIYFEKYKRLEMNLQKEYFFKHNINFNCEEQTDLQHKFIRAAFTVKPLIRVEFRFLGNLDQGSIDLVETNFKQLGEQVYTLNPQEINEGFLDELAKYLTYQPTELVLTQKYQRKKNPLPKKLKDNLAFDLWLQQQRREQGDEDLSKRQKQPAYDLDFDEFNHWLQHQETQLKQKLLKHKQGFFQTLVNRFKKASP